MLCDGVCVWWRPYDAHSQRRLLRAAVRLLRRLCGARSPVSTREEHRLPV